MVNIYDIAKEAGVAASTVSRVINNKPGIKAETRERIQRLLKKYDYSPNENARGLANRSSRTIGVLIPDIRELNHTTSAFTLQSELSAGGYFSVIINTGENEDDLSGHLRLLRQRQVDGLVMIGSYYQRPRMQEHIAEFLSTIPIVMANGGLDLPNVYTVIMDEVSGVANMVDLLWRKGRRNFAFVTTIKHLAASDRKLEGFRRGMAAHGKRDDLWIYRCENSAQGGYDVTVDIVRQHPEVDAIMFSWDLEATGALRALMDMGIKVPDRIAVSGVDNSPYCELCYPKLSSVDVKHRDMCRAAARTILELLSGAESVRHLIIPPGLVERETT